MPSSGMTGTRMLRARRKDQNVKPNRRLDRKSSRGMLFENEELRMRTITINAEVEQGQHALKKLRRENEQLRREMWSLRDEYDKMEKLLRNKKGDNDDDSDQDYDSEYSQSEESDEETKNPTEGNTEENPDLENEENLQKSSRFNNLPLRSFDGLSVIDEQTEETTQTTDSTAPGYGGYSRGNSLGRALGYNSNDWNRRPMYDEACGGISYPALTVTDFDITGEHNEEIRQQRKKGVCMYNGAEYQQWAVDPWEVKGNYGMRPSSPYPYNKNTSQTPYSKRIELLQNLPVYDPTWPYSEPITQYGFVLPEVPQPATDPITVQIPTIPEYDFDVIQPRTGPDYFITGAYPQTPLLTTQQGQEDGVNVNLIQENNNNMIEDTDQGHCEVKKEELLPKIDVNKQNASASLTSAEHDEKENEELTANVSVVCQSSTEQQPPLQQHQQRHLAEDDKSSGNSLVDFPKIKTKIDLFEKSVLSEISDMPRSTQTVPQRRPATATKPFQSKLQVTLKNPPNKKEVKSFPSKLQPINAPITDKTRLRTFSPINRYQFPGPKLSVYPQNGTGYQCSENSEIVETEPQQLDNIPNNTASRKTPPEPPPRTTSFSGNNTIPGTSIGVTALHHRAFRKGRSQSPKLFQDASATAPIILETNQNPLLNGLQPIATSSPQMKSKNQEHDEKTNGIKTSSNNDDSSLDETLLARQTSTKSDVTIQGSPKLSRHKNSPNLSHFRKSFRKQSQISLSSLENIPNYSSSSQLIERKNSKHRQNNISVSSSSGLDSPTKSDKRKRRVSIKFNKKQPIEESKIDENLESEMKKKESVTSRKSIKDKFTKHRSRSKNEEEVSERERTNSVSSRTSSIVNSSRRKFSISSTKTLSTDDKIPWCGCWGNGCV